jgi:hypothetical protein
MRPSRRLLLFSSQEYSIISQSVLSVNVRVFFHGFVKVLGISTSPLQRDAFTAVLAGTSNTQIAAP